MSARILLTSIIAMAGAASPAMAFHPCGGGGTHFFGLTWGHSPAPRSFGGTGQAFGVTPFGAAPSAVPFGVVPYNVVPTTVVPFGVTPFGVGPSAEAEAQAINWLNLILRGSQFFNGTNVGGGVTSRDLATLNTSVQSLKTELAALRATNEKIYRELVQIRKGEKTDPPAPKKSADTGDNNPNVKKVPDAPSSAPSYAQVDRDLNDIAAMQQRIAEKEARMEKLRAARNPVPNGTGVASNR